MGDEDYYLTKRTDPPPRPNADATPPRPKTNAELIEAITGFRRQLDEFADRTSSNLEWLTDGLKARLDAADRKAEQHMHPEKKIK